MTVEDGTRSGAGHRERLLAAAIECLERKGYARTTARDLVAASGTNLASIGYHFGSKDRLLDEALALALRSWFDPLIELSRRPSDATLFERLEIAIRGFVATLEHNRGLVTALCEGLAQAERSEELRLAIAENWERSRATIAELIAANTGDRELVERGVDPSSVAAMVIALVDGLMLQWYVDPERLPPADELLGSVAALLPLIFGSPEQGQGTRGRESPRRPAAGRR